MSYYNYRYNNYRNYSNKYGGRRKRYYRRKQDEALGIFLLIAAPFIWIMFMWGKIVSFLQLHKNEIIFSLVVFLIFGFYFYKKIYKPWRINRDKLRKIEEEKLVSQIILLILSYHQKNLSYNLYYSHILYLLYFL